MRYGKKLGKVTEQSIVGKFRLTKSAREDLIAIAQYGDTHFSVAQSDRYRDQLKQRFSLLAEQPMLSPSVEHIHRGYRRSVCGAHSIYYKLEGDIVHFVRVLGRQDIKKAF